MKFIRTAIIRVKEIINRYDREYGGVMNYSYADTFRGSYM